MPQGMSHCFIFIILNQEYFHPGKEIISCRTMAAILHIILNLKFIANTQTQLAYSTFFKELCFSDF